MRPIETVRQFVECFLRSRSRLESPGSSLGGQLEALRYSVDGSLFIRDDGDASRAALGPMSRLVEHGWLALVWGALTPFQQEVVELAYTAKYAVQISVERTLSEMEGHDGIELMRLIYDEGGELTDRGVFQVTEPINHTTKDIAEKLGVSDVAVRRAISKANSRIREKLARGADEELLSEAGA